MRLAGNQPTVLIPVPLDPIHHRRRGFNQAALLATELSRATGLPSVEALGRRSATRRQAGSGRTRESRKRPWGILLEIDGSGAHGKYDPHR